MCALQESSPFTRIVVSKSSWVYVLVRCCSWRIVSLDTRTCVCICLSECVRVRVHVCALLAGVSQPVFCVIVLINLNIYCYPILTIIIGSACLLCSVCVRLSVFYMIFYSSGDWLLLWRNSHTAIHADWKYYSLSLLLLSPSSSSSSLSSSSQSSRHSIHITGLRICAHSLARFVCSFVRSFGCLCGRTVHLLYLPRSSVVQLYSQYSISACQYPFTHLYVYCLWACHLLHLLQRVYDVRSFVRSLIRLLARLIAHSPTFFTHEICYYCCFVWGIVCQSFVRCDSSTPY